MKKIYIIETKKCDTRSNGGLLFTMDDLEKETEYHIQAVCSCCNFLSNKLITQAINHDNTKLGDNLPAFYEALKTGASGKDFKNLAWWKLHITKERHHLNDKCPDDVNLLDVLEMIADCVCAGMARTGSVYDIKISNDILQKAVSNTQKLLTDNIKVVKKGEKQYE